LNDWYRVKIKADDISAEAHRFVESSAASDHGIQNYGSFHSTPFVESSPVSILDKVFQNDAKRRSASSGPPLV
jgi:hypothetical protein